MHITMGAEFSLNLHIEGTATYAQLESALVDAGFEVYTIMRNVNVDDTCDVQLFVRNAPGDGGMQDPLDAVETIQKLAAAVDTLENELPDNNEEPA